MPEETTTVAPTTTLCPTTTPDPYESVWIDVDYKDGTAPHVITLNLKDYCPLEYSSYIINFGDSPQITTYTSLSDVKYTYFYDGTYIITLSAVTINGETVLKNTDPIQVNIKPTDDKTNITINKKSGKVPLEVDIDFETDSELDHQQIEINYGDGTTETVDKKDFNNITHIYKFPGNYVVSVIATDKYGYKHVYYYTSLSITVEDIPNNPNNNGGNMGGGGGIIYNTTQTTNPPPPPPPSIPVTPEWVTTTVCECYPPIPTTPDVPPPFTLPTTIPSVNVVVELTTPSPLNPLTLEITTTTTSTTTTSTTTTTTTTTVVPPFIPCKTGCNSLNY